jgi:hypothetical protein
VTRFSKITNVVLAVTVAAVAWSGCGSDDGAATEERIRAERAEARAEGRKEERLRELERRLRKQEKDAGRDRARGGGGGGGGSPAPGASAGGGNCGDGIVAGPKTTCPFARNVRSTYYASGQDPVIEVWSPVTRRSYTMTCSGGSPHRCTGGDDASVTFP